MATITKSYAENQRSPDYPSATLATHTIAVTKTSNSIYMGDGSTFTFGSATASFKYNTSANYRDALDDSLHIEYQAGNMVSPVTCNFWTGTARVSANVNTTVTASITDAYTYTTATFFNSNNSTAISVPFSMRVTGYSLFTGTYNSQGGLDVVGYREYTAVSDTWTKICDIVLNAPPTFTTTQVSTDTNYIYAGLTTASVTISSLSAKFGGTISSATLKIGEQTATRTTNGTLSISLDTVGTFTPTVTVTDSRGQTATETLTAITVNGYTAPSVSFDVERTLATGAPDDEGTYAVIDATLTFADVIATAQAPTVTVTDQNGTTTTATVTWYSSRASDGTLSGTVTWANLSSGDTVYGLVSGFGTQYSYQITVTPADIIQSGTAITQTLGSAFYTVDFLAGGHGIAFGQPASQTGFYCNMDTHLLQGVDITGNANITGNATTADMTAQEVEDFVDSLDTHALDVTYMKRDLLWTNSTDPFASQTVSLDLSAYDYVEVWFNSRIGTVDAMLPNPLQIPKNERREIVHIHGLGDTNANENIGMRSVTVYATGVTFGNYAYKNRRTGGGLTTANQFAVPNKIYGVKYY